MAKSLQALSVSWFQQQLDQYPKTSRFWIALSGGLDSRVLLELCAHVLDRQVSTEHQPYRFSVIHVNHQLQPDAEQWAQFCVEICRSLNLEICVVVVKVKSGQGRSLEQAARDARRQAFSDVMQSGDILLTAHHLNDQAEAVLLRLFRGSGVTGLGGIRPVVKFEPGWMARPLLSVSRQQLQDYARQHELQFIEDPSNQSHDHDRNYLRHAIIPQLEGRWPGLQTTLARNARHLRQTDRFLNEQVSKIIPQVLDQSGCILTQELSAFDCFKRQLLFRKWFELYDISMPSSTLLEQIESDIVSARIDADPCLSWNSDGQCIQVRRYRNKLFLIKNPPILDTNIVIPWDGQSRLDLPANLGYLRAEVSNKGGIDKSLWATATIEIRFRQGGETCLLPGREGHRSLKAVFQEFNIPPWERAQVPLIFLNEELAAIASLVVCSPFYIADDQQAVKIIQHSSRYNITHSNPVHDRCGKL